MVCHMVNSSLDLDAAFHALSDATRRSVIHRLTRGPASVSELAGAFEMGLPAFLKHLRVLEDSGLIRSRKQGRVRTCEVRSEHLAAAESWLSEQRALWQGRTDRLAAYVETVIAPKETPE